MSMISSVSSAVATLATGLEAINTPSPRASPGAAGSAQLGTPGRLDLLSAKVASGKAASPRTAAPKTAASRTAARKPAVKKPAAGYASGTDFAFLKDPSLSVEEKLFRFMCAIAKRNDDAVVKKMEEMKGEAAKAAAKSGGTSGTKKSSGFTVWGALKVILPALGFTAQVLGDAKLKSMLTQVSGPVLAAGATALGLPMLAPLALSVGPGLTGAILDSKVSEGAAGGPAASGGSTSTSGSGSTSSSAAAGRNEQVQLMELQRLIDKQKEMFAMVSNILRAQHDTRMSIIGNVR